MISVRLLPALSSLLWVLSLKASTALPCDSYCPHGFTPAPSVTVPCAGVPPSPWVTSSDQPSGSPTPIRVVSARLYQFWKGAWIAEVDLDPVPSQIPVATSGRAA